VIEGWRLAPPSAWLELAAEHPVSDGHDAVRAALVREQHMQSERRARAAQHEGKDSLPPAQALDPERDSERHPDQHAEERDAVGVHAANHIEVGYLSKTDGVQSLGLASGLAF
jgi:hypothetical protein